MGTSKMATLGFVIAIIMLAGTYSASPCSQKRCRTRHRLRPAGHIVFDTPTGTLDGSGKKQIIIVSWMGKKTLPFPGFPGSGIGKVWSSSADSNVCKDPDDKIVINQCVAPPGPPSFIEVTDITATSFKVAWGIPNIPNGHILRYEVRYWQTNLTEEEHTLKNVVPNQDGPHGYERQTLSIEDLDPETEYGVKITAVNFISRGEPVTINVTTFAKVPFSLVGVISGAILLILLSAVLFLLFFRRKRHPKKDRNVHPRQHRERRQLPALPLERYQVFYNSGDEKGDPNVDLGLEAQALSDDFYSFCIDSKNDIKDAVSVDPVGLGAKFQCGKPPQTTSQFPGRAGTLPGMLIEEDYGEIYDETEIDTKPDYVKTLTGLMDTGKLKQNKKGKEVNNGTSDKTGKKKLKMKKKENNKKPGIVSWTKSSNRLSCKDFGDVYDDTVVDTQEGDDFGENYDDVDIDHETIDYYGSNSELYDETEVAQNDHGDFYETTVSPEEETDDLSKPVVIEPAKSFRFANIFTARTSKKKNKANEKKEKVGKMASLNEGKDEESDEDIYDEPDLVKETVQSRQLPPAATPNPSGKMILATAGNSGDTGGEYCYEVSTSKMEGRGEGDGEELYEETEGGDDEEIYELI
ncbi:uncharacterized protein [Apostichopus japonicus]|uniref:uncharacterized protein isoform X2 n=1 Tax=Stichopus japonicus TaxID=307972 RepID=UPI003AB2DE46